MTRRYRLSLVGFIAISIIALTGFGCLPGVTTSAPGSDITLVVWGLWQETEHLGAAIASFQEATKIKIEYKKIASVADYEHELLAALAEGRGPDIFVIHHTWVARREGILSPAPESIIDERALSEEFVDVVTDDLLLNGKIYALPLSVDTLALYYNKDILSAAGIARPPTTWDEFQQVVERLTKVNRFGAIEQSAAALGTATNVSRAADIIQLLIKQSGQSIATKQNTQVSISREEGERALAFYTDFANKSKQVYTWDLQQDYSIDAFAEGETAMMLNYSYQMSTIKAKNPRLRFAIAPVLQIADGQTVNFAAYWPFAVSKSSTQTDIAWQFLRHLTGPDQAARINQAQQTPPARRDGVVQFQRDPNLGVFAEQTLTATSWPRADIAKVDTIFNTMIDSVITGAATISESLRRAQDQLNQLRPESEEPPQEASTTDVQPGAVDIGIF